MKRLFAILSILLMCQSAYAGTITVDTLVSADDITLQWLNGFKNTVVDALNSIPGDNMQANSLTADAFDDNTNIVTFRDEAFNDFVFTGLLPPTSATLISITTAGTAYISGTRVAKDATSNTYTASKDTYVDLSNNGTYTYAEVANGAAEPATTSNSIRLVKVVTNGTAVTSVVDSRVTGVQIATNEDFQIEGLELYWSTTSAVSVDAGLLYNGATRVRKSSATILNVGTASDYINGASERGTSKWIYVYSNSSGSIKLDDTAPDYADVSANTVGMLRYYKVGTAYWRLIGAIRLNATGSGNINVFFQRENLVMWDVPVIITTTPSVAAWSAALSCATGIPAISTSVIFGLECADGGGAEARLWIRPNGSTWALNESNGIGDTNTNTPTSGQRTCATDSSQQIQHYASTLTDTIGIDVEGYYIRR